MRRKVGEIFTVPSTGNRKLIKTPNGLEFYAVFIAKQNPEICGEWFKGCEVHHKDGDCSNDVPENLICLTPQEHHQAHIELGNHPHKKNNDKIQKQVNRKPQKKPITVYFEGEYCGTYPSIQNVTDTFGIPRLVISHYIKRQIPFSSNWKEYSFEVNT